MSKKLPKSEILDFFNHFIDFWEGFKSKPINLQVKLWKREYLSNNKDLVDKLIKNYEDDGFDWRDIALKKIFPNLSVRLPLMKKAYKNLKPSIKPVFEKALKIMGLNFDVKFVIYVGIGNGAGWATRFRGSRACLFGLENIAELGWIETNDLMPLIAHELGHLIHHEWREEENLRSESTSPYWSLYEEGFAQYCEHLIMERNSWHQAKHERNWLAWCIANKPVLAYKFMENVGEKRPNKEFFGSWYDISGVKFTGYYIGHELIRKWETDYTIKEICLFPLEKIDNLVKIALKGWMSTS